MINLSNAGIAVMLVLTVILFVQSLRGFYGKQVGRGLFLLGCTLVSLFVLLVGGIQSSVTFGALVDASAVLLGVIWSVLTVGLVLMIVAKPVDAIRRQVQLRKLRQMERAAAGQDEEPQHAGVEVFDQQHEQ